ncbi:sensor histidine kinase [Microbacterium sp. NPDC056052]|uniref:sensor histidine kinase n=1 Tax=Microbacterium sp. NPDC056052 TaxID=3345695 RepID=UPI0035DD1457
MSRILLRIQPMTGWSAVVNTAGLLAVGWVLWRVAPETAPWVVWLFGAGLAAWAVRMVLAVRIAAVGGDPAPQPGPEAAPADRPAAGRHRAQARAAAILLAVMGLAGSLTAVPTQGLGTALLVAAVIMLTGDPAVPPGLWIAAAILAALGVAAGALLTAAGFAGSLTPSALGLITILAALALAVVVGLGRRAQRVLLAERERASAETLRAQAAAHRIAIARDLHDVLAHSLGGLVVQLDAVEALLDVGDTERAAARVAAARGLAVEGLGEAREAVRALREPEPEPETGSGSADPVAPSVVETRIRALIAAEQGVRLDVHGVSRPVSGVLAEALVRAVQEGVSNARKHAPGASVRVGLVWHPDRVECTIENPVMPAQDRVLAATGGGYGLRGVRERFAVLGGTVQAGVAAGLENTAGNTAGNAGDRFVLRAEAPA